MHWHPNIPTAPGKHQLPKNLAACIFSSTCRREAGAGGGCSEMGAPIWKPPLTLFLNPYTHTWPTLRANLPDPASGPSLLFPARICGDHGFRLPRQELYKVKSFPHALCRLLLPQSTSEPLCTQQLGLCSRRSAPASAPGSQINTLKSPRTLATAGDPPFHRALSPWSSSPSALD